MHRFTTLAHVEEEITLVRNNWNGQDLAFYLDYMKALHNRRRELLGLRGALV